MRIKVCFKCKRSLPISEYYSQSRMSDSLLGKCKDCTKLDVSNNRWANIEKIREYDRQRYRSNPARRLDIYERTKLRRAQYPEKRRANDAAYNAVRDGRLIKPEKCSRCGLRGRRIEAHHPDYSKPLAVIWVCTTCHRLIEGKTTHK